MRFFSLGVAVFALCWLLLGLAGMAPSSGKVRGDEGATETKREEGLRRFKLPKGERWRASAKKRFLMQQSDPSTAPLHPPNIQEDDIIMVEGSSKPMFLCSEEDISCREAAKVQQDEILTQIQEQFPGAELVSQSYKIVNVVFIKLPASTPMHAVKLRGITGVRRVAPHVTYYPSLLEETVQHIGAAKAQGEFCATGKGVKIAVLDTGIDYTHEALGGPGTTSAYDRAFGRNEGDPRNQVRDGMFPTERVYDGFDFLGDLYDGRGQAFPDNDPIDSPDGHGTLVSSSIAAVAPDAKLLAIKICGTNGDISCPLFATIQGIEFALDPNNDGNLDDKVDIINLSLGAPIFSAFYDERSFAFENAFKLGVLTVAAVGNYGNLPYLVGIPGSSANVLTVAATEFPDGGNEEAIILDSSSRGPGEFNRVKPEICAPQGASVARAGTGSGYRIGPGTSLSAPVVSGAAALVKEKCPECSPFAIKALLMNNAFRNVTAAAGTSQLAPITRAGSGEIRIDASLDADFWAYSPDRGDVQPSLSLGVVDAAEDVIIRRTITIVSLTDEIQILDIAFSFQDPVQEASGALEIEASPYFIVIEGCSFEVSFEVEFRITASKAPPNFMGSGGSLGSDPSTLDKNEFGGHILVKSADTGKEIGLPFMMILRQASNVVAQNLALPPTTTAAFETRFSLALENKGAGIAQIDAFTLLGTSEDDPEAPYGEGQLPGDLRAVGYRTLEVGEPNCSYMIEFALVFWERKEHLYPIFPIIILDTNQDLTQDFELFVDGVRDVSTMVYNTATGGISCTGLPVDHATNTRNLVVRTCAEDVGLSLGEERSIIVAFGVQTLPSEVDLTDTLGSFRITLPGSTLTAPSVDIYPGDVLGDYTITISADRLPSDSVEEGMILVTNSFREEGRTGSATTETETIFILREGITVPLERTPDREAFPDAEDRTGPQCLWQNNFCSIVPTGQPTTSSLDTTAPTVAWTFSPTTTQRPTQQPFAEPDLLTGPTCVLEDVPRAEVPTKSPSVSSSPSVAPFPGQTSAPTDRPTLDPTSTMPRTSAPVSLQPLSGSAAFTKSRFLSWAAVVTTELLFICCI